MKQFIRKIAFFTIPVLMLLYPLDVLLSKYLRTSNLFAHSEFPVWNDLYSGNINSDILIYGSSKACVQVDPKMIEFALKKTTYNLGMTGHNFWLQNFRHELVLKQNKIPKTIIHIVDIGSLIKNPDLFNSDQFLPYMLWNKSIKNATESYNGFTPTDYIIPLLRYHGNVRALFYSVYCGLFPKKNILYKHKGYLPNDIPWNGDFDRVKKKIKFIKLNLHQPSIELFDNYLKDCKLKNINVILVYPPEFFEGQKFEVNRAEIIKLFKHFSKKYDIPYHDFSDDTICKQKKYFYNATHLNKTGAEFFTKQLIDTLKIKNEY